MKTVEKMTSDELKEQILNAELPQDDGMAPDSPGYAPAEEEIEISDSEEEVEASEPEEERDIYDIILEEQKKKEEEQVARMDAQTRSLYKKAEREVAQRQIGEIQFDFQEDAEEFASKYREFPEVIQKFGDDFRFGRLGVQLSNDEFATCESPQEELFFKWLRKHGKGVSSDTMKKIINHANSGPKLKSRIRDKIKGYSKQTKKMSDEEIKAIVDSYFSEEQG